LGFLSILIWLFFSSRGSRWARREKEDVEEKKGDRQEKPTLGDIGDVECGRNKEIG